MAASNVSLPELPSAFKAWRDDVDYSPELQDTPQVSIIPLIAVWSAVRKRTSPQRLMVHEFVTDLLADKDTTTCLVAGRSACMYANMIKLNTNIQRPTYPSSGPDTVERMIVEREWSVEPAEINSGVLAIASIVGHAFYNDRNSGNQSGMLTLNPFGPNSERPTLWMGLGFENSNNFVRGLDRNE